jgi:L-asparaginase
VCIIYGHLGLDKVFVETTIKNEFKGIISAGMGKGYQSCAINQLFYSAIVQGIIIVRCSRTSQGTVNVEKNLDDSKGFIAGGTISPQKARILLFVALSKTSDKKEIQRIFEQY